MRIPVILLLMVLFLAPTTAPAAESGEPGISERCLQKPVYGHCKANMEIHSFNSTSGTCEVSYGCPEFTPFQTKQECRSACERQNIVAQHEYAVLEALLKAYDSSPWWHIEEKTLAEQLDRNTAAFLEAPGLPGEAGITLDEAMIRDFNQKNRISFVLAHEFTAGKKTVMFKSSHGIRTIAVSRPGFNADRTRAIVFLRDDFRHPPEVFMQEGFFMLLERTGNTWTLTKRIKTSLKHS